MTAPGPSCRSRKAGYRPGGQRFICPSDVLSLFISRRGEMPDKNHFHKHPPARIRTASMASSHTWRKYPARSPVVPPNRFPAEAEIMQKYKERRCKGETARYGGEPDHPPAACCCPEDQDDAHPAFSAPRPEMCGEARCSSPPGSSPRRSRLRIWRGGT